MNTINYYKVLQVDPSADPEVIEAAYKRLSQKYHPDKNSAPDANQRMQEINNAHEVLGNPGRRAFYDRERTNAQTKTRYETAESRAKARAEADAKARAEAKIIYGSICQRCGRVAQTKTVAFHQQINILIFRQKKMAEGQLCKECARYYFWSYTSKTLFFGWWNPWYIIVALSYIFKNIFYYIRTLRLKRPEGEWHKQNYSYKEFPDIDSVLTKEQRDSGLYLVQEGDVIHLKRAVDCNILATFFAETTSLDYIRYSAQKFI